MVSGRWQQCHGPGHRQPARKFRGSSARSESGRAIGAALRSPGSDGFIRRKPMELWDETPTAAQAAVGVSVCGVIPVDGFPTRIGLVVAVAAKNLVTAFAAAVSF